MNGQLRNWMEGDEVYEWLIRFQDVSFAFATSLTSLPFDETIYPTLSMTASLFPYLNPYSASGLIAKYFSQWSEFNSHIRWQIFDSRIQLRYDDNDSSIPWQVLMSRLNIHLEILFTTSFFPTAMIWITRIVTHTLYAMNAQLLPENHWISNELKQCYKHIFTKLPQALICLLYTSPSPRD